MEWILVIALAMWALRVESLQDIAAGAIGWLMLLGLGTAMFWALVIFPSFAIVIGTVTLAGATLYLLHRYSLSDSRIDDAIRKRRRELGYDE